MNLFTEIYNFIDTKPPGWCDLDKALTLACMVVGLRPAVTVEIGVFGGRSALPMAMAHKAIGHGMLYAIDPWDKAASVEGYEGADLEWWSSVDHESIYQYFMLQIKLRGLENVTRVIRNKSDDVAPMPGIGLLHVDGQHTDQAVRDVLRFASEVMFGGIVVMDDIAWRGGGVARAVKTLESLHFRELYKLGTGAVYQRI